MFFPCSKRDQKLSPYYKKSYRGQSAISEGIQIISTVCIYYFNKQIHCFDIKLKQIKLLNMYNVAYFNYRGTKAEVLIP